MIYFHCAPTFQSFLVLVLKCVLYSVNPYDEELYCNAYRVQKRVRGEVFTGEGGQGFPVGRGYMSMATERESNTFWLEYLPSWTDFSHFFNFYNPPRPSLEGFLVISSILQIPQVRGHAQVLH